MQEKHAPIYLDHTASSQVSEKVAERVAERLTQLYANPAALHRAGQEAEQVLRQSLDLIGVELSCQANQLVVTSGATESVNTAFWNAMKRAKTSRRRILVCEGEHEVSHACMSRAKEEGFLTEYYPLTASGCPDLEALEARLKQQDDVAFISCIWVNNETGAVVDLDRLLALKQRYAKEALLHLDAVQALGKTQLKLRRKEGLDFASFSGHKLYAPKGIGLLYVENPRRFRPFILGSGQQHGLRSGTENPVLVEALALALQHLKEEGTLEERNQKVTNLRMKLLDLLKPAAPYIVHGSELPSESQVPHILSISFPGLQGETLMHILEREQIFVTTGSACHARSKPGSHVLRAMNTPEEELKSVLRISLSHHNTEEEMEVCAKTICEAVLHLRR